MKYLITFIILIILSSCSADKAMHKAMHQVEYGMSLEEFKEAFPKATLVGMEDGGMYYKLKIKKAQFGAAGGFVQSVRFFYFINNRLERIDEGVRATDVRIKIDHN